MILASIIHEEWTMLARIIHQEWIMGAILAI